MISKIRFEVQFIDKSSWETEGFFDDANEAFNAASKLIAQEKYSSIRINKSKTSLDEYLFDKPTLNLEESPSTKLTNIVPIKNTPYCKNTTELFNFESRLCIGRLIRNYLDNAGVTVLEILHLRKPYQQINLASNEKFLESAINYIATLQSYTGDISRAKRYDEIKHMIQKIPFYQEKFAGLNIYGMIEERGFLNTIENTLKKIDSDVQDYAIGSAIALHISKSRQWSGKIELLLDLCKKELSPKAAFYIDEVIAEILDGSEACHDIMGRHTDYFSTLMVMVGLCKGEHKQLKNNPEYIEIFAKFMANHNMPITRKALIGHICNMLSYLCPLTKENEKIELQAFADLTRYLIDGSKLIGGARLAEALTLRARPILAISKDLQTSEEAVKGILLLLHSESVKLHYLFSLTQSHIYEKCRNYIDEKIISMVSQWKNLEDIINTNETRADAIKAIMSLIDAVTETQLSNENKQILAKRFENLLSSKPDLNNDDERLKESCTNNSNDEDKSSNFSRNYFNAGDVIFREAEDGTDAYLIVSGRVEIFTRKDGKKLPLGTLKRGDIFGEMSLIDDKPRMASAKAIEDTELTLIPEKEFKKRLSKLETSDPVMRRLIDVFIRRIRHNAKN